MTCEDHKGDVRVQDSLDGNVVGDEMQQILTQFQGVSGKNLRNRSGTNQSTVLADLQ